MVDENTLRTVVREMHQSYQHPRYKTNLHSTNAAITTELTNEYIGRKKDLFERILAQKNTLLKQYKCPHPDCPVRHPKKLDKIRKHLQEQSEICGKYGEAEGFESLALMKPEMKSIQPYGCNHPGCNKTLLNFDYMVTHLQENHINDYGSTIRYKVNWDRYPVTDIQIDI